MSAKYQVPIGNNKTAKVTPAQFDAALNWQGRTELEPDLPRRVHEVFPERDNWANGQRRCCTALIEKGVLCKVGEGFVLGKKAWAHLDFYRYH